MKTRLGKRLNALFDAIPPGYDSAWDLCCDHGRLGMSLLETRRTEQVHFVDRVTSIMAQLEQRLTAYGAENYRLHIQDATTIELPAQGRNLAVLAGIGDEVTIAILSSASSPKVSTNITANPERHMDWLISPANNLFQVRTFLRDNNFGLLNEGIVFENRRGYEWLRVTTDRLKAPDPVTLRAGFWNPDRADHRAHLTRLVRHANRQLHNPEQTDARQMLELYQAVLTPTD